MPVASPSICRGNLSNPLVLQLQCLIMLHTAKQLTVWFLNDSQSLTRFSLLLFFDRSSLYMTETHYVREAHKDVMDNNMRLSLGHFTFWISPSIPCTDYVYSQATRSKLSCPQIFTSKGVMQTSRRLTAIVSQKCHGWTSASLFVCITPVS